MFRILSGILTIGNLEFLIDEEGFTRQNFDEEKTRHNLAIVAVSRQEKKNNNNNTCQSNKIQRTFSSICLVSVRI